MTEESAPTSSLKRKLDETQADQNGTSSEQQPAKRQRTEPASPSAPAPAATSNQAVLDACAKFEGAAAVHGAHRLIAACFPDLQNLLREFDSEQYLSKFAHGACGFPRDSPDLCCTELASMDARALQEKMKEIKHVHLSLSFDLCTLLHCCRCFGSYRVACSPRNARRQDAEHYRESGGFQLKLPVGAVRTRDVGGWLVAARDRRVL